MLGRIFAFIILSIMGTGTLFGTYELFMDSLRLNEEYSTHMGMAYIFGAFLLCGGLCLYALGFKILFDKKFP